MYGALIPPIYQTSTFYFDSTDDAVKACDDYAESFAYSRITNPSVDYLEQKLAALEHGKGAVAYASGMGAVSGAIFALLKSGDHAIFTKAKYSGTEDVTSDWLPRFGIEPYREDAHSGFLRHAVVRVGHTSGEMLVTLVTNGREFPGSRAFCRELVKRCAGITTIVQNVNARQTNVILGDKERVLFGPGFILDTLCGLTFRISSQSFYQVNSAQTEVLYRQAIELAGFTGAEHAIDAYCGTGTIGLVAASMGAAQVTGVDCVESSIRDARQNARHNGVDNARFAVADAGAFMRDMAAQAAAAGRAGTDEEGRPLVLLMDPPRAGSTEEFLRAAVQLAPERIAYISCNPETQVRDLGFLKQFGYGVRTVQPVDMFPHTDHIETIALIERM